MRVGEQEGIKKYIRSWLLGGSYVQLRSIALIITATQFSNNTLWFILKQYDKKKHGAKKNKIKVREAKYFRSKEKK